MKIFFSLPHFPLPFSISTGWRFQLSLKVPDVYGVFQFKVEYQKLGYTSLSLSKQILVRPYRHNEYERFIPTAYPYYGAAFSMMAGFLIFTFVHLYSK
ncbi:Dolichyl-diphosphooligosaccharide-protein glycosyltransferase 48kDa subunit family protein [Theobroma cacao]|uniref:Dolichyl-diphosphooligosaccharide-protein glycosyltransferase 48kDa subunit family protein n=1 Tax=Theobroma cacao TaxID=3641 RepID=A0A061FJZ3_THECC|nr:Dolichyl-diphosphooligosaccharide-protein glycosyltransferase 48kDa subunit family protein [Theobroma cacao]